MHLHPPLWILPVCKVWIQHRGAQVLSRGVYETFAPSVLGQIGSIRAHRETCILVANNSSKAYTSSEVERYSRTVTPFAWSPSSDSEGSLPSRLEDAHLPEDSEQVIETGSRKRRRGPQAAIRRLSFHKHRQLQRTPLLLLPRGVERGTRGPGGILNSIRLSHVFAVGCYTFFSSGYFSNHSFNVSRLITAFLS